MPLDERKIILEACRYVNEVFVSIDEDKSVCKSVMSIADRFRDSDIIFAKGGDVSISKGFPELSTCRLLDIKVVVGLGSKIQSSSNLTGIHS